MKTPPKPRGGAREGAGRKKGRKGVAITAYVSNETKAKLDAMKPRLKSTGKAIDHLASLAK